MEIKFDKRNYRKHSDSNKRKIKKSLQECGAGRSVLVDADGCLIAGNGVYEQASALGIPTRVIETDGSELVVVKRTDLQTDDDKRKILAAADNITSDNVEWDFDNIGLDADVLNAAGWDIKMKVKEDEDSEPDVEFTEILDEESNYIVLKFNSKVDWLQACTLFGIDRKKEQYRDSESRMGVGRIMDGTKALNKLTEL